MNDLHKNIIKSHTYQYLKDVDRYTYQNIKRYLVLAIYEPSLSAYKLINFILLGFIHYKKDHTYGFIIGISSYHFEITFNYINIFRIQIMNLITIGLLKDRSGAAYGIMVRVLIINIQFMFGKRNYNFKNSKVYKNKHLIIAES